MPLERAWNLVSANPARAAGLTSKGSIADGKDADLIIADQRDGSPLSVRGVISSGKLVFVAGRLIRRHFQDNYQPRGLSGIE